MQAIVETLFDAVYLTSVIAIGVTMIVKSRGNKEYWLFGIMAVVLGAGDAFHLAGLPVQQSANFDSCFQINSSYLPF